MGSANYRLSRRHALIRAQESIASGHLGRAVAAAASACLIAIAAVAVVTGTNGVVIETGTYLTIHTLLELGSILVSFAIFAVNWQASTQTKSFRSLLLGSGFLAVALLDTMHTLSFNGMPAFVSPNNPNKAIYYWLAARLAEAAVALTMASLWRVIRRPVSHRWPFAVGALIPVGITFLAVTYDYGSLPLMFVDGSGLTPLKIALEGLVIVINLTALVVLWRLHEKEEQRTVAFLGAGLVVMIFTELSLTHYLSVYDTFNLLGHLFKVIAYYLVFRALFVSSVDEPYQRLKHAHDELAALSAAAASTASSLDMGYVCRTILGHARKLTGTLWGFVEVFEEGSVLQVVYVSGPGIHAMVDRVHVDTPHFAKLRAAFRSRVVRGDVVNVHNVSRELCDGEGISTLLEVPLSGVHGVIGALGLMDPSKRFSENDVSALVALANQVAMAVQNARLYGKTDEALKLKMDEYAALLREAERERLFLQTVIDQIPQGVVICDPRGNVSASNRAARQMYADHPDNEQAVLCNPTGEPYAAADLPIARSAREGVTCVNVEMLIKSSNGQDHPVLCSSAPISSDGAEPIGAVAVFQDIREIKELNQLRDDFLRVAAHELRSPLTSLKGFSQLLLRKISADGWQDTMLERLQTIDSQASKVASLVDRLLDASRAQMSKLELEPARMDLTEMIHEVASEMQVTSQRHTISERLELPSVIGMWDYQRLRQVLTNLVGNAIKYSPNGGTIEVGLRREGDNTLVWVSDEGMGIPQDALPHLFSRYYRAHHPKQTKADGLGLGLFISQEIIVQHGGRMWVDSKEAAGSTFYFAVPS